MRSNFATEIYKFDNVAPGLFFRFDRLVSEDMYDKLRGGDFTPLFGVEATDVNGLKLVQNFRDWVTVNWFEEVTRFYAELVWQDPPEISSTDQTVESWIRSNLSTIYHVGREATELASSKGAGVIRVESGKLYVVDTSNFFRVVSTEDSNVELGYILAYPFNSNPDQTLTRNVIIADSVDFVIIEENGQPAVRRRYAYSGNTVGTPVSTMTTNPVFVSWFGNCVSDYRDIVNLVRAYIVRLTADGRVLNRFANPHISGPAGALEVDEEGNRKFSYNSSNSMYLPREPSDVAFEYLSWESALPDSKTHLKTLREDIIRLTGLSDTAVGLNPEDNSSSRSRDKEMLTARGRALALRRGVEGSLRSAIGVASGGDPETITFDWLDDQFIPYADRVNNDLRLYQAGAISQETLQRRLRLPIEAVIPPTNNIGGNNARS